MNPRRGDNPYIRAISFLLSLMALAVIFVVIAAVRSPSWTAALLTDNVGLELKGFWSGIWACTHSQGYWKNYPEEWPVAELPLGAEIYTQGEALVLLETPPKGDASLILVHQLIAARLNVASGNDGSPVADASAAADDWLDGYEGRLPYEIGCSSPDGQVAVTLAVTLYEYNSGLLGPGGCDEEGIDSEAPLCTGELIKSLPVTATVTLPLTATVTVTATPEVTLTITPEVTPEPTGETEATPTATSPITPTITPTATWTPTGEPTLSPTPTVTITASIIAEPTEEMTLTLTVTPTLTYTYTYTYTPTVEPTNTPTPTSTYTPTPEPTNPPMPTSTYTPTPEPTDTPAPTPTHTTIPTATPEPVTVGTSLAVTITAEGFWTGDPDLDPAGVQGEICVYNNGGASTENLAILDVIQVKTGADPFSDYQTTPLDLSEKPVLAPGETYCFQYEITFLPLEGATYRNVARVTITNHSGWLPGSTHCPGPEPCAFGPEPKADFALP